MAIALLSVPTPHHQLPIFQRPYTSRSNSNTNTWLHGSTPLIRYPSKPIIPFCSSTSIVEDGPSPPPPEAIPVQLESATEDTDQLPLRGCKACGREEVEKGCNGEGRIQGGIATFPGFGWWPIKAYRPCPGFLASGGRYRRQGQSMDEVAFGRGEKRTPVGTSSEDQSSKKKEGPSRFKR